MNVLKTNITGNDVHSTRNRIHNEGLASELQGRTKEVMSGGPAEAMALHRKRGKLPARERIAALLDSGSEWLEFSPLAAWGVYDNHVPSAGIMTGVGYISGRPCVIVANDATVKGGTYFPLTIKKHLRAQEIAIQNRLPAIYLVDSGGIFLPKQAEVFADKEHFGRIFYNQARMSGLGIPQVAMVMGMCTAGGAYVPAMCDENVMVKGTGTIYLAGPPLVKAATGEDVTAEELGGSDLHTRLSGVCDYQVENDQEALELCRTLVSNFGKSFPHVSRNLKSEEPLFPASDLYQLIPPTSREPYDVREVIARLVDGSQFQEFKARYGTTLICGFAGWKGHRVGVMGNNGVLFQESALKGAHFVQLCNQRRLPIIFLQNIPGFMVGKQYEEQGIIKAGSKMVQAVATANVPKLTVMIGASHGAGNYAMCGRAFNSRFLFTWPNSRTSVMGGAQAAHVLSSIKQRKGVGQKASRQEGNGSVSHEKILAQYEEEGSAYYSTAHLWDDGILDPIETRKVLGMCLDIAYQSPRAEFRHPVYRM